MGKNEIQVKIDSYIEQNQEHFVEVLARLVAQPSISATGEGIEACTKLVADVLADHGFDSEIMPSNGRPFVFGKGAGRNEKTILFYNHYDVQPTEPLELWNTPPFELTRKGDQLFGRGAADDKGHLVSRIAGVAAARHALGEIPCNVKFIFEGEEEVGSPSIHAFIERNRELLAADGCVWEYGGVDHSDRPTQVLGMRGICYVELSVETASSDAHSGLGGSIFPNAAWRLVWALNSLKDANERILIPGFYDSVQPPDDADLALLSKLPDESRQMKEMYGLKGFLRGMEGGVALKQAAIFEPTCTICGLTSGYQGAGSKTVLPAQASAKIDFRLVPDQKPEEVLVQLRSHLDERGFSDVKVRHLNSTYPARTAPDHPFVQLTLKTAAEAYGIEMAVSPMSGGSGPIHPFVHELGLPVVATGVSHPGSSIHAPNENIRIKDFVQGIRHVAYLVEAFGRTQ